MAKKCSICDQPSVSRTFLRSGEEFFRCQDHLDVTIEEYESGIIKNNMNKWKDDLIDEFTMLVMREDNSEHSIKSLLREFAYRLESQIRQQDY